MIITFEEREAFSVFGYSVKTDLAHNDQDLKTLWDLRNHLLTQNASGDPCLYGILRLTDASHYHYMLGVNAKGRQDIPRNMSRIHLPGGSYACAKVISTLTAIQAWTQFINLELPRLCCDVDKTQDIFFERYDKQGNYTLWAPARRGEAPELSQE